MDQSYDKIINLVKNNISGANDGHVQFSDQNYAPFSFDIKNFQLIENRTSGGKMAFIDGGSSEIIKSSNFSLNLIRVYYAIYENNKRVKSKKSEFYSFISAKNIDNELFYNVDFIKLNNENNIIPSNEDLLFSSQDETIRQGITRASISSVANIIRRFSEIKMAANIIDDLNENDIIVLDGSLQCTYTNEKKYFGGLYRKSAEKNVIICGLSKTMTLMTDKGNSIANALNKFNFEGKWAYHPVADIKNPQHEAEMSFVKLHEKSRHIFRFEIYKEQKEKLMETICLLSDNCRDPVFFGYPYGLIDADKNARVPDQEKDMLLTLFSAKFGKDWGKVRNSLSNIDAHDILDKIG